MRSNIASLISPLLTISLLLTGSFISAAQDGGMKPFVLDHRGSAGSVIDLSSLLESPAGKAGFVRIAGGHLVTADGRRLRLWGVNVTDWSRGSTMLPSKEDAPMWAATLARFGVNCVRLHFLDLPAPRGLIDSTQADTRSFDSQQLDRLDYWTAELRKRGIYLNFNLNVGRSYKAADGVKDADRIRWAKGLTLFDRRLIELQKEYAKNLLTHYNPYTKSEYRNEPAVAIVEILNENALYMGFRSPTLSYESDLLDKYNTWLRQRLGANQLDRLRAAANAGAEDPVPRLTSREIATAPADRFQAELRFVMEQERDFYREMSSYLREDLKVKCPIVATADHSHSGSSYPMLHSTSLMDVVDGHTYWQHPGSRGPHNTPMVNRPHGSTVVELSRTAFAGKPYTVSEVNHPFPSDYGAEGIPILAAYGALQDWDGIFWYTFELKRSPDWSPVIGDAFDISHDPIKMPQLAAGALMFIRGDISPARRTTKRSYSIEQVYESIRLPSSEAPYFTPGFPLSLPLRHGSRIGSLDGRPTEKLDLPESDPIVSDTGELTWDITPKDSGVVTVDTDRTQAQIGFLNANARRLRHLSAEIANRFASIILTSLDSNPLARSRRMLLTAGARSANSGMEWNEERTAVKQWGGSPTLIEPVTGRLILRNLAGARRVWVTPLDGRGQRIGSAVNAARNVDGWIVQLGGEVTTWYEINVDR